MDLEGNLSDIEVLPMLLNLHRQRFTGAVRFERGDVLKLIYFRDGDLIFASTNDSTDAIDEILIRAGKITRDHARQAVAKRRDTETVGDALLNLGFVTRKEVSWARRLQLVSIIRSLSDWRDGTYGLVADHLPKRDDGALFHLPQVVVEAIVTDEDRELAERATDGGAAVYRRSASFDAHYSELGLNEDADSVARHIDGRRSAADLASFSSEGPFAVFKLLRALVLLGLIERVDKPQVIPEIQERARPAEPEVTLEEYPEEVPGDFGASVPIPEDAHRRSRAIPIIAAVLLVLIAAAVVAMRNKLKPAGTRSAPKASTTIAPVSTAPTSTASEAVVEDAPPAPAVTREVPIEEPAPIRIVTPPPDRPVVRNEPPVSRATPPAPARDPLRDRYDAMAKEFVRTRGATTPFTLQIALVCQTESVRTATEIAGNRIWFVPIQFRGQSCYRLFWGSYPTRAAAEQAMEEVPRTYREESRPVAIDVRQVLTQ